MKDYLKELSLVILGVLIALLIDNFREDRRDDQIIKSYLDIVLEDLTFDIENLTAQLKRDSVYSVNLKVLSDVLTTNADLPNLEYGLSWWTRHEYDKVTHRKLSTWDSLDYYTLELYANTDYKVRKIGFSTIVNSNLSHRISQDLLKQITIYYTTESDYLDFVAAIDSKCLWNAIPYLNQYQGRFKEVILTKDFNTTLLRNEASGRYNTTLTEMKVKRSLLEKAKYLRDQIKEYQL